MLNSINSQFSNSIPISFENLLIKYKFLTQDQIDALRHEQAHTSDSQVTLIAKSQLIDANVLKNMLVENYQVPAFIASDHDLSSVRGLEDKLNYKYFKDHLCVPFYFDSDNSILYIASVDVLNIKIHSYVQQIFQANYIQVFAATSAEIFNLIDALTHSVCPLEKFLFSASSEDEKYFQNLADLIVQDAVTQNATDIHFDVSNLFLVFRYRIDGILIDCLNLHNKLWSRLLNCFKVKSNLNITEIRLPQSGRFTIDYKSQIIDCRFSTHPTLYGECAVIRLLNHDRGLIPLSELGFTRAQVNTLITQCNKPHGLVIFTGPTGSGKTTSLYAILREIANKEKSYITLEDPIEYKIDTMRQSQINSAVGFDYKSGIKSILRQDPDIILIGEIRDEATALMAIRAAMTGHLVLTTLHVNNVFQIAQRFQDLGIILTQLAGLIRCVVSQRLLRCLCLKCYNQDQKVNCKNCEGRGYKGRTVIAEMLSFEDEMDSVFIKGSQAELKKHAQANGFKSMHACALEKLKQGATSLYEIDRVLG